jgi:hypothetical protein
MRRPAPGKAGLGLGAARAAGAHLPELGGGWPGPERAQLLPSRRGPGQRGLRRPAGGPPQAGSPAIQAPLAALAQRRAPARAPAGRGFIRGNLALLLLAVSLAAPLLPCC